MVLQKTSFQTETFHSRPQSPHRGGLSRTSDDTPSNPVFILVMACLAFIHLGGCSQKQRMETVDLADGRLPEGVAISIDGRSDSTWVDGELFDREWGHGVTVPFEEAGKATFAWDDEAIYGRVHKYEHLRLLWPGQDRICVEVGSKSVAVYLYYGHPVFSVHAPTTMPAYTPTTMPAHALTEERWDSAFTLQQVHVSDGHRTKEMPLPDDLIESVAGWQNHQQGIGWGLEFRLAWEAVGVADPNRQPAYVRVYRLAPARSPCLAAMNTP